MAPAKRTYPLITQIEDRYSRESFRLLWDKAHGSTEDLNSLSAQVNAQATTIADLSTRLGDAETTIRRLRLQVAANASSGSSGGGGDLTDPPVSGPVPSTATQTFPGLGSVTTYASPVVDSWAEVGTLGFTFSPGLLTLAISQLGAWSANPINIGGATQAATIWLFLQISGSWVGAGGERLRPNQSTKAENTLYSLWPGDWFYNGTWGPLGIVPTAGQSAAILVTAGSTRVDNRTNFTERTPVVQFAWPADGTTVSF